MCPNAPIHAAKSTIGSDTKVETEQQAVELVVRVGNINYAALHTQGNSMLLEMFTNTLKVHFAKEAGDGVQPEHVTLSLSAGSVIVEASIRPPASIAATSVQQSLEKNPQMLSQMAYSLSEVDGIAAVRTGDVSASYISAPAVRAVLSAAAATPAPASQGSSSRRNIAIFVGLCVGALAVLGVCFLACFCLKLCPCHRQKSVKSKHGQALEGGADNIVMMV